MSRQQQRTELCLGIPQARGMSTAVRQHSAPTLTQSTPLVFLQAGVDPKHSRVLRRQDFAEEARRGLLQTPARQVQCWITNKGMLSK